MKKKVVRKPKDFAIRTTYEIFEISSEGHLKVPMVWDDSMFRDFGYDSVEKAKEDILAQAKERGFGGSKYFIMPVYSAEEKLEQEEESKLLDALDDK